MFDVNENLLKNKKMMKVLKLFIMAVWTVYWYNTETFYYYSVWYSNYFFIGLISIICLITYDDSNDTDKKIDRIALVLALFFSIIVIMGNYAYVISQPAPEHEGPISQSFMSRVMILIKGIVVLSGGTLVFYEIIKRIKIIAEDHSWKFGTDNDKPVRFFLISVVLMSVVNICFLFLCSYPGIMTPDSIDQFNQTMSGEYSNHHPFYHTMLIKLSVGLGNFLFGSLKAGVATYSFLQIILIASAFSYALVTMYQLGGVNQKVIILCGIFYVIMPYNIYFSVTMWKDVPFACSLLFYVVSMYRYLNKVGNKPKLNLIAVFVAGMGMCLLRSNGLIAFIISFIGMLIVVRKSIKPSVYVLLIVVIICSWIMKYPVLTMLDVSQPDRVESLSVPIQQIASVVEECDDLNEEEIELISQLIDIEDSKPKHWRQVSDGLKNKIRDNGNQYLIDEQLSDYIKLYIGLGLRHPIVYLCAWIDQTCGYWSGGNYYSTLPHAGWIIGQYGINYTCNSRLLTAFLDWYSWCFYNVNILKPFISIGLHTWILILLIYVGCVRKDRYAVNAMFPVVGVLITLLIATPVYSEFRYAYSLFCCIPFYFVIAFSKKREQ